MSVKSYNIRVYGLLIYNDSVLVTQEFRAGMRMTKFPGGGHELGEGIGACVVREIREELEIEVELDELFYVNDFLQISAFNKEEQLISFYYKLRYEDMKSLSFQGQTIKKAGDQIFYWVKISEIDAAQFTFPVDRVVAKKLKGL